MRARKGVALFLILIWMRPHEVKAWSGPEHEGLGMAAFNTACGLEGFPEPCNKGVNRVRARDGLAEPDHCHSYVDSALVNDDCASEKLSVLPSNENHFGAFTRPHFRGFFNHALEAARRYRINKQNGASQRIIDSCEELAIELASFAGHYLTDRSAAGHAWNPTPRYQGVSFGQVGRMQIMRACFHGQTRGDDFKLTFAGPSYACFNPPRRGLNDGGQRFARPFFASSSQAPWWSDGELFLSSPPEQRIEQTLKPMREAFRVVLRTMEGMQGLKNNEACADRLDWTPTWVSNVDFCRVVLSQCCRRPTGNSLGECSFCLPDISDAEVKSLCPSTIPLDLSESVRGNAAEIYQSSSEVFGWSLVSQAADYGGSVVAETIALTGSTDAAHPDAQAEFNRDIVRELGCTIDGGASGCTSAAFPSASGVFLAASKVYNPSRWCDATIAFGRTRTFQFPDRIQVVSGNGGNHFLTLRFWKGDCSPGTETICFYKGGSDQAHPTSEDQVNRGKWYHFDRCEGGNGSREGDHLRLHLDGGDNRAGRTTVNVNLNFSGS